jgi:hypothetical protein
MASFPCLPVSTWQAHMKVIFRCFVHEYVSLWSWALLCTKHEGINTWQWEAIGASTRNSTVYCGDRSLSGFWASTLDIIAEWLCRWKFPVWILYIDLQQFAFKHKPQTFSRVSLRLKRGVYRWKRKCFTAHVTCYSAKPNSVIFHVLMCFRVRFSISKLAIL